MASFLCWFIRFLFVFPALYMNYCFYGWLLSRWIGDPMSLQDCMNKGFDGCIPTMFFAAYIAGMWMYRGDMLEKCFNKLEKDGNAG